MCTSPSTPSLGPKFLRYDNELNLGLTPLPSTLFIIVLNTVFGTGHSPSPSPFLLNASAEGEEELVVRKVTWRLTYG